MLVTLLLVLSLVANMSLGIILWIDRQTTRDMKEEIQVLLEERAFDMKAAEEDVFRRIM